MLRHCPIWLLILPLTFAADEAWKTKRVADWTEEETKQILNDSPWAVAVTTSVKKEEKHGHGGFVGAIPGVRRRGNPNSSQEPENNPSPSDAPQVHLRWESALPIREAELKAREINAPVVDEDRYAIAVYGIPSHFTKNPRNAGDSLKGQAALKREGQKDLKPSHVDVLERDDGLVIVFLFPRTKEFTVEDAQVEFDALIGPYQIAQSFHIDQMVYHGKLEM